jgi:hypothetical protein
MADEEDTVTLPQFLAFVSDEESITVLKNTAQMHDQPSENVMEAGSY